MRIEAGDTTYLARDQAELRWLLNLEPDEFWAAVPEGQLRALSEAVGEPEAALSTGWVNSLEARWLRCNDPEEHTRRMSALVRETMLKHLNQAEGRVKLGMAMSQMMTRVRNSTSPLRRLFSVREVPDVPETCCGSSPADAAGTPDGEHPELPTPEAQESA